MSTTRKAILVYDESDATTYLKPFSEEHSNFLIAINEDAYGEFTGLLKPIEEIRENFNGSEEEFNEMLKQLGV